MHGFTRLNKIKVPVFDEGTVVTKAGFVNPAFAENFWVSAIAPTQPTRYTACQRVTFIYDFENGFMRLPKQLRTENIIMQDGLRPLF